MNTGRASSSMSTLTPPGKRTGRRHSASTNGCCKSIPMKLWKQARARRSKQRSSQVRPWMLSALPRKNHVLGRWMRHAGIYPDYQTRLFRRDHGRWIEREVHAHVIVPGEVRNLQRHIMHFRNAQPLEATAQSRPLHTLRSRRAAQTGNRFGWSRVILRPWLVFLHRYFWLKVFSKAGEG